MEQENNPQPGILPPPPSFARYLTADIREGVSPEALRSALSSLDISEHLVVGLGPGLVESLGLENPELRPFPDLSANGVSVPSTQADLWLWIRSETPGDAVLEGGNLVESLSSLFDFDAPVDGFKHGKAPEGRGRDLTGYEDGTENPVGEEAVSVALDEQGGSYVSVQRWLHDLAGFERIDPQERDLMIGRRLEDNEEIDDAPDTAHVKRTAQETFTPEAFSLRRSLPWAGPSGEGLMFVSFGCSLDAFEAQMRRMAGHDDGLTDSLFRFSTPLTGGHFWCPPVVEGAFQLDPVTTPAT